MSVAYFRRQCRRAVPCGGVLIGTLTAVMPVHGAADESPYLSEPPVVLSATRLKQSRHETPTAVTVIDRHMIDASGARTMADLLRLVPGMQTAYATGNRQVVTYHGLADEFARRMQVLVDGRSVYLPSFGGVTWTSLPLVLEDIDRIEVIRGPNSASYGSNAFLGVISIITRHAAEDAGTAVKLVRGDSDIADGLLRHGGHHGNLDYRVTASYQQDEGFTGPTYTDDGRPWDNNDWHRVRRLTTRFDLQPSATDHWQLQAGATESPQGDGSLLSDGLEDPPITQIERNNFLQLRWEHSGPDGHELQLQFHRDEHETEERLFIGPLVETITVDGITGVGTGFVALDASIRTQRYDLEFQHRYTPDPRSRWVWGSSLRVDRAKSRGWFGTGQWQHNNWWRLFGNGEIHLGERLLLNAGAMLERNSIIGIDVSPRIALNYRLADQHSLRAAVSKATRTPALIEEFSDASTRIVGTIDAGVFGVLPLDIPDQLLLSSGNIKRERITATELGYFGEFYRRRLQLDLKLFYEEVRDLITDTPTGQPSLLAGSTADFTNTDSVRSSGVEAQLDWRPAPLSLLRLGYSHINMDSSDRLENYSESAPQNSYTLFASHRFPKRVDASLAYHYTDEMEWLEWNPIDSISRLDVRLAKGFRLHGFDAELALVAQNILGEHQEFRRGNAFDQRTFVQLSLAP